MEGQRERKQIYKSKILPAIRIPWGRGRGVWGGGYYSYCNQFILSVRPYRMYGSGSHASFIPSYL